MKYLNIIILAVLLTACGGGGGSNDDLGLNTPPSNNTPINTEGKPLTWGASSWDQSTWNE